MRLFLVEDDTQLGEALQAWLSQEGYAIDWCRRGDHAIRILATDHFDGIILDLGLPGCSGSEVLKKLRDSQRSDPVLVLTARDDIEDRVSGLDLGADDYLVKPFDMAELSARLRALLRRSKGRANPIIQRGDIAVEPATREVTKHGKPVNLSGREYAIFLWLMENQNRVATRSMLCDTIYGFEGPGLESNAIEVHISHLRGKLGSGVIKTIRGVGYTVPSL